MLPHKVALTLLGCVVMLQSCNTPQPTTNPEAQASPTTNAVPVDSSQLPDASSDLAASSQASPQTESTVAQAQDDIRTELVQFTAGSTSTVIEDAIQGYEIIDYLLNARAGQYMNVSMATDNGANYFNILAPDETEVAMFNGSVSQNQYEGTLPADGDYRIRVYLMRSAARRNEVANYRLEMIIVDQENAEAVPSTDATEDALVPGTNYNATGEIPCAMTQPEPNGFCPFGVVREGNGNGFVEVTTPYGNTFSIYFQDGEAVGAEGGSGTFSTTRSGDQTFVYIGEERYVIPDAVIFGG